MEIDIDKNVPSELTEIIIKVYKLRQQLKKQVKDCSKEVKNDLKKFDQTITESLEKNEIDKETELKVKNNLRK